MDGLQLMYMAAVVGGIAGGVMLLFPALAAGRLFFGEIAVGPMLKMIGAVWLAIGLLAFFGLGAPEAWLPLLLLQFVYKSIWLVFVALPNLLARRMTRALWVYTGLFALWVLALGVVLPFADLAG